MLDRAFTDKEKIAKLSAINEGSSAGWSCRNESKREGVSMKKRNTRKHLIGVAVLSMGLASAGYADTYKLDVNQTGWQDWHTLTNWVNVAGGAHPAAILPADDFDMDGKVLRGATNASPSFAGGSLISNGGPILFKHTGMATITNFAEVEGALLINGVGGTQGVHLVNFTANTWTQFQSDPDRGLDFQIEGWTGAGALRTGNKSSATGYYGMTVTDALGFSGEFRSTFGTTEWNNDADISSATYWINSAGHPKVVLNHDIRVGTLLIGTTPYTMGVYSFAVLNAAHDAEFVDGGTGSITVGMGPAPEIPPYTQWASQYPTMGSQTNQTDDPDIDGLNNLYEWGLGGDPTNSADIGHVPSFGIVEDGGSGWFEYIHAQRNDADDLGLGYYLALRTDLVAGTVTSNDYVVGTGTLDSEFDAVTNRIPTDVEDEQFIKLMIESN